MVAFQESPFFWVEFKLAVAGDLSLCATTRETVRKKGEWGRKRKGREKRLDNLPSEGFSEFDPAVLALEETD